MFVILKLKKNKKDHVCRLACAEPPSIWPDTQAQSFRSSHISLSMFFFFNFFLLKSTINKLFVMIF